ncbi:MAG: hypothetical protein AAF297_04335 [Planctomycetota bacterium]
MLARHTPIAFLLALVALATAAQPAAAQAADAIQAVEPRWVIVLEDETPLRCGDFDRFYAVAQLEAGEPLRLDGQSDAWARVIYPESLTALVSARDAEVVGSDDQGRRLVRLVRPSKLRAANISPNVGVAGSWRSVFKTALPVDTRLVVVENIRNGNGDVEGYRVLPPRDPEVVPHLPHAYLALDAVREASLFETAELNGEEPVQPEPAQPETEQAETSQPETPQQDPTEPDASEAASETELVAPAIGAGVGAGAGLETGGDQPADPEAQTPGSEAPAADAPSSTPPADPTNDEPAAPTTEARSDPAGTEDAGQQVQASSPPADQSTTPESDSAADPAMPPAADPTAEPEPEPEPAPPLSIEDLEAEFTRVRSLGRTALDDSLDELINEYERTKATLDAPVLVRIADNRLAWLNLRRETRDERRDLDAALAAADNRTQAIRERLATLERTRRYAVVGRLVPSALYTGERLPLMYRIESVGGSSGARTLGYVRPREGDDLRGKLGELVGVVGDVRIDRALNLMLVRPVRIDVLTIDQP